MLREHGRDQRDGGGAGTRGDQGVIDCYRDRETCPFAVRQVKTRQSYVPQALFVPDDLQLMSYLVQST